MADDIHNDSTDIQKDNIQDEELLEEQEQETQEQSQEQETSESQKQDVEDKESFLGRLGNMLKGKSTEEAKPDSEKTEEDSTEEELGDEIPDEFVEAARKADWSNDDITTFAGKYTDKQLLEMIDHLGGTDEVPEDVEEDVKGDDDLLKKLADADVDSDILEQVVKPILSSNKTLQEKVESLEESLSEVSKDAELRKWVGYQDMADRMFDSDEEEFGKTETLPKFPDGRYVPTNEKFKARDQVWQKAIAFSKLGSSFGEALKDALRWYRGGVSEKKIHRKLVSDLKNNEKRLTAKRSERHLQKTYESEEDEKEDVMRSVMHKAGIDI